MGFFGGGGSAHLVSEQSVANVEGKALDSVDAVDANKEEQGAAAADGAGDGGDSGAAAGTSGGEAAGGNEEGKEGAAAAAAAGGGPEGGDPEDDRPAQMDTLNDHEKASLRRLQSLVKFMDTGMKVPVVNYRFGMDAVVGTVPYVGDATGALVGTYIVSKALEYHLPKRLVMRMAINQAIDACAGVVPFIGDLFDASYKANTRNMQLLEAHLQKPAQARRADACYLFWVFFIVIVMPFTLVILVVAGIIVGILAAFGVIG